MTAARRRADIFGCLGPGPNDSLTRSSRPFNPQPTRPARAAAAPAWQASSLAMDPTPTSTVTVAVPGALRDYCSGASQLSLSAPTVRGLLEQLERDHASLYCNVCDETGRVRRHVNLFVNAENVRDLAGLDTALVRGDVVSILPAVSGG